MKRADRDPKLQSHACRLNCGCQDESMLHLVQCRYTKAYWNAVVRFLQTVLGLPGVQKIECLIIFNEIRGKIVPTEACAFIRHAFNAFYRDFAMVDTHGKSFIWQRSFNRAMISFRNAVLAWAESIKIFTTRRMYTKLKQQVPQETLKQFPKLVTFEDRGFTYNLTSDFKKAIDDAEAAAKTP